nr:hypothetical protein [Mycoplasmopsis bovis]
MSKCIAWWRNSKWHCFSRWVNGQFITEFEMIIKEYGWNEIEQLKPNDEKFNKNILELLDAILDILWK